MGEVETDEVPAPGVEPFSDFLRRWGTVNRPLDPFVQLSKVGDEPDFT